MNSTKTGLFIAQLRRARGWTQNELAGQLGVTDKAVSRWETGRGFPDIGILAPLAETLGVSVIELMNGERAAAQASAAQADAAVVDTLLRTRRMIRKMAGLLVLLFGIGTLVFRMLYIAGDLAAPVLTAGISMVLAGALMLFVKWEPVQARIRGKLRLKLCAACALWLALLLELLPCSVRMAFAAGPDERIYESVSYFSLLPFGYGNIFPFLTACLTLVTAFMLLLLCLRGRQMPGLQNAAFFCTAAVLVLSAFAAFFGANVTAAGVGILLLLAVSAVLQYLGNYRGA